MNTSAQNAEPAGNARRGLLVFPVEVSLRLTRRSEVSHHSAAMVGQLLKAAAAQAGLADAFPPRIIPDPVEVGRMTLDEQTHFNFGLTLWDPTEAACHLRWSRLLDSLRQIGARRAKSSRRGAAARPGVPAEHTRPAVHAGRDAGGLGGNFIVDRVRSLVDPASELPRAVPSQWYAAQAEAARRCPSLTLRWLSPLQAKLPRRFGKPSGKFGDHRAGFFDTRRFPVADLIRRLIGRLTDEFQFDFGSLTIDDGDLRLLDPPGRDALHWIKWQYGPVQAHKSLFGVMGRMVVQLRRPELCLPLVLGQYTGVGEKTNFGLGRYVIEELQRAPLDQVPRAQRAARGRSLVELALSSPVIQREAQRMDEPVAEIRRLTERIGAGDYQAGPVERFLLPGDKPRMLAVPSRAERAVQRSVHELLAPVLDRFLSDSCLAYRKGLGRKTAAERIHRAFREGWRWALRADFHRFFDSVDHQLLRHKLEVYVQDDAMVDLLMQWVIAGAPQPGRGLPTGAVISPLLANLFLEQFDQQVQEDGGLLVRYADDFVLLFRDPAKGRQVLERAGQLAERLKLHLNDDKTKLVDLEKTPFDFLGYRFFAEKGWQYHGDGLVQVEDLGWHEAPRGRLSPSTHPLPGETGIETSRSGIWIVGPQVDWVGIEGKDVVCRSVQQGTEDRFQRRRVSELIVLGHATLDRSLFRNRDPDHPLALLLADDAGRWTCALTNEPPLELPGLVRAQVALADDPPRRLTFARRLIAAKLRNYAVLALAYPARNSSGNLGEKLRSLAEQALQAGDDQQLLGIEGAGAAAWYGEFARRIDRRYSFERREHPNADDPVNVMLNLAQTVLHRLICLTLIREGFAPSIGFWHRDGERHAALASDLQEPFRYLMDRVVIDATGIIAPGEFHEGNSGRFALRMEAGTYRTIIAAIFKTLATQCVGVQQQAARSYRRQIATTCRSLHRHLVNPEALFKLFEHV